MSSEEKEIGMEEEDLGRGGYSIQVGLESCIWSGKAGK